MELQRLVLISTRSVQVCVWVLRMREKTECGVRSTGENVMFTVMIVSSPVFSLWILWRHKVGGIKLEV